MKKEDIKFLKELQKQMKNQDTCGTANPRYWVVKELKRIYVGNDTDVNGVEVISEGDVVARNLGELVEFVYEDLINDYTVIYNKDTENVELIKDMHHYSFDDTEEFLYFLYSQQYLDEYVTYGMKYIEEYMVVENTFFLTLEECKRHISVNGYHYNDPMPYCMHAWRSPQVDKLYKILQNTDWDELEG